MDIKELIKNDEVVSIVGAGGKTNLIRLIAKSFRNTKKVLITSTVDIERIPEREIDFIDYEYREDYLLKKEDANGVYLLSSGISNDNLLKELSDTMINNLVKNFDLSLIECDISKKRNFKAWRENEPSVPSSTTLIIGVIDITTIGRKIDVDTIYNLDVFIDITKKNVGDIIEDNDLVKVITSNHGMFNKSRCEKVILINKAEDDSSIEKALKLGLKLKNNNFDKILFGSIINEKFTEIK